MLFLASAGNFERDEATKTIAKCVCTTKDPAVTTSHRPQRGVLERSRAKDGGRVDVRVQSVGRSVRVEERGTHERAPQRGRWSDEPFEAGVPVP